MEAAELNRFLQLRGVAPTIQYQDANGKFACTIWAQGIGHTGRGIAPNKKKAKEFAVNNLHSWLKKQGLLSELEEPAAKKRKTESGAKASALAKPSAPAISPARPLAMIKPVGPPVPTTAPHLVQPSAAAKGSGQWIMPAKKLTPAAGAVASQAAASTIVPKVGGAKLPSEAITPGMSQTSEPPPKVASQQGTPGTLNEANARGRLNTVLQTWRQKTEMKMSSSGPPHLPNFKAWLGFKIPMSHTWVEDSFIAKSKKEAQNGLALKLCRRLIGMGVMSKTVKTKKAASVMDSLDESPYWKDGMFGFKLNPYMEQTLRRFLSERGYHPCPKGQEVMLSWSAMCPSVLKNPWANGEAFARVLPWASPAFTTRRPWPSPQIQEAYDPTQAYFLKQAGRASLPVDKHRETIVDAISNSKVTIIQGATGSGKTTQVPQFVLDHQDGSQKCIVVVQPRRISAISVAQRVAAERGEGVGQSVGYAVRFDARWPRHMDSICYMTTGLFLKRLHSRGLQGISHVIVDEIHQRHLDNDLLLSMLRHAVAEHDGFKVILMSATIDAEKFQGYMSCGSQLEAPVVHVEGRMFDVQVFYLEDIKELIPAHCHNVEESTAVTSGEEHIPMEIIKGLVKFVLGQKKGSTAQDDGAILIFMPTWASMSQLLKKMQQEMEIRQASTFVLLHSQIPREEQMAAFKPAPAGTTKVIISTDIAESSITISDVSVVIDACRVKLAAFSGATGLSTFAVTWAGRVNLEQRKGRAGRTREGMCFRLCHRAFFESELQDEVPPELLRTPLTEACLLIKSLSLGDPQAVLGSCLDPPDPLSIEFAMAELRQVRAINEYDELTPLGRALARLPLSPRMGLSLLMAHWFFDLGPPMALLCATMSFDEPFWVDHSGGYLSWRLCRRYSGTGKHSDHFVLAMIHQEYTKLVRMHGEEAAKDFCQRENLHPATMRQVRDAWTQLRIIVERKDMQAILTEEEQEDSFDPEFPDLNHGNLTAPRNFRDWTPGEWQWGALQLLLAIALPHIGVHEDRRKMWVGSENLGVMHRCSVNSSTGADLPFPSPFFAFLEQVKDEGDTWKQTRCRQLTMIPPILAVLRPFSSGEICSTGEKGQIMIAEWLPLSPVETSTVHMLLFLRSYIEDQMAELAKQHDPKATVDTGLSDLLKEMLVPAHMVPRGVRTR